MKLQQAALFEEDAPRKLDASLSPEEIFRQLSQVSY